MNKQSVRDEVDKIKSQFAELKQQGRVSPEMLALTDSLFLIFELILSIFLEKKTQKTSKNSGIPPSQTGKDETTPKTGSNSKAKKTQA